jgi:PTS system mannose-specific IID component
MRSFLVQGSWNYETLIGTGFAFVLLPALRVVYACDPDRLRRALARHASLFNSHPYLAPVAIGAVARLEATGTDEAIIERFKAALRGSLGSLGDQLVWLLWRPTVGLLGVALVLAGAPWWVGVAAFLIVYNALHVWLRVWGLNTGLSAGLQVAAQIRDAPFQLWGRRIAGAGALLTGFCFVLALAHIPGGAGDVGLAAAAGLAGLWLGTRVRPVLWVALTVAWAVGILIGTVSFRVF